ncbi:LOW QUALITY PROTEIN: hypothetical protein PanWU01x14_065190 [Parasponia andersonii]|uniref:Uncharacterized protein n=1 Tax=Parasponia andersonii TaxID=3476 RepID=A0A2P5DGS1_PARAD|nr:LOW QUALITY PROTEIN: hypothetical protein PanWU01x14_065190 [Parasponia andersonii]
MLENISNFVTGKKKKKKCVLNGPVGHQHHEKQLDEFHLIYSRDTSRTVEPTSLLLLVSMYTSNKSFFRKMGSGENGKFSS